MATTSAAESGAAAEKPNIEFDPVHEMILSQWPLDRVELCVTKLARMAAETSLLLRGNPPAERGPTEHVSAVERLAHPVVDAHIHGVDFLQRTDGFDELVRQMHRSNVTHSVIFGLPVKKRFDWTEIPPDALATARQSVPLTYHDLKDRYGPASYLSDDSKCYYYAHTDDIIEQQISRLPIADQKKFIPLLVGFNPTDLDAVEYIRQRLQQTPGFWKGVGEVLLRHDYLTMLTREETASVAHPAMDPIFALCEEMSLPLLIHQNISNVTVISSSLPTDIEAATPRNMRYFWELKQALESCKNHKYHFPIVWAHIGISLGIHVKDYIEFLETSVFPLYDNLYVDISWVVYDDVMCIHRKDKEPKVIPAWVRFCCNHSDRIMIGSDLTGHWKDVTGKPKDFYARTIGRYHKLLRQVAKRSPQAAYNIAAGNAMKVFNVV
ncbi:amidohydrolase family protein [Pelomyxa schiedti]|nr:amidohydrolase family protein [Pelomyxa schiedti]